MKLRSYNFIKARKADWKQWLNGTRQAIALRSSPYIHSEIQFSDRFGGISFSSTTEDKAKGCRFKNIGYSSPFWDTVEIPVTQEEEDYCFYQAQVLAGLSGIWYDSEVVQNCLMNGVCFGKDHRGYDLIGLLSFGTPLEIITPDTTKMWCSESCAEVIQTVKKLGLQADRTHPARLHERCLELFGESK